MTKSKYKSEVERTSVQFPREEYAPLRIAAAKKGVGPGMYVRNLVRKHLARIKHSA
jgi:hypothetical protein